MIETAYAKINLALHLRGRRADGYHDIETLFAFVDQGDVLSARPAAQDSVTMAGEFAGAVGDPFGNLVARALAALPRDNGIAITLEKNLPVAAGLGGGSADAGAVFRIVREMHGLPDNWEQRAEKLGADVPACVNSEMALGSGTGTQLSPVENDLAGLPVLLANPRMALATGPVFAAWDGQDHGPLPTGSARTIAQEGRNDMEAGAISLCPPIADVLAALRQTEAWCVRMSGSGATCFALYENDWARSRAAAELRAAHPGWWFMEGNLR
jgi:4-diphosphocytidyl-2-C-methyl-D-erythritol kinase